MPLVPGAAAKRSHVLAVECPAAQLTPKRDVIVITSMVVRLPATHNRGIRDRLTAVSALWRDIGGITGLVIVLAVVDSVFTIN